MTVINDRGEKIDLLSPNKYPDPSAAILTHVTIIDAPEGAENRFIVAGFSAVTNEAKLAAGGSLNKNESFEDGMSREHAEEMFHGYEKANQDQLFPTLTAGDVQIAYLQDKSKEPKGAYVRLTGLAQVKMTTAEFQSKLAEMNKAAAHALADRAALLDNPKFPESVGSDPKQMADKKSRFYVGNLKKDLQAKQIAGSDTAELDVLVAKLEKISEYSEYKSYHAIGQNELITKIAEWDVKGKSKAPIEMTDANGQELRVSSFAVKDAYPIFAFAPVFESNYSLAVKKHSQSDNKSVRSSMTFSPAASQSSPQREANPPSDKSSSKVEDEAKMKGTTFPRK